MSSLSLDQSLQRLGPGAIAYLNKVGYRITTQPPANIVQIRQPPKQTGVKRILQKLINGIFH